MKWLSSAGVLPMTEPTFLAQGGAESAREITTFWTEGSARLAAALCHRCNRCDQRGVARGGFQPQQAAGTFAHVGTAPGVDDVTVKYSPFWVTKSPKPARTTVVFEKSAQSQDADSGAKDDGETAGDE